MHWPTSKVFAAVLLFCFSQGAFAQKNYAIRWGTDLALSGLGLSTNIAGYAVGRTIKPLKPDFIAALNRNDLFPIDLKSTYRASAKADRMSDFFFYGATIAPFLLLANPKVREETGVVSLLYMETLTLNNGFTLLTKNLVRRPRPYVYNPEHPYQLKVRRDARKSFFSGHTSSTAASCFFAAKVWSDFHPENKWKPAVWAVAAGFPAVTGLLRMRAGKHFFTDIAAGYVVGSVIGWLIPALHKRR